MVTVGWKTFLIVCPLLFVAGFVDSAAGGGGLISLPAYLLAGLPAHQAIATNKLSAASGMSLATYRFARRGLINWRLAAPAVAASLTGSWCGAHLSLLIETAVLEKILYVILPLTAIVVFRGRVLKDQAEPVVSGSKLIVLIVAISFVIGAYDGFYGPGTGTFLIIAFSYFAGMDVRSANGLCKAVNLASGLASLAVYLHSGLVMVWLGLAGAVCNMAGSWLGSGMAIRSGTKFTRPIILFVLFLLFLRVLGVF